MWNRVADVAERPAHLQEGHQREAHLHLHGVADHKQQEQLWLKGLVEIAFSLFFKFVILKLFYLNISEPDSIAMFLNADKPFSIFGEMFGFAELAIRDQFREFRRIKLIFHHLVSV